MSLSTGNSYARAAVRHKQQSEIIDLLHDDDDEGIRPQKMLPTSAASPIELDLFEDLSRNQTRQGLLDVDLIDLRDTKPPAVDISRNQPSRKRPWSSNEMNEEVILLDNLRNQKPPPFASRPEKLPTEASEPKEKTPLMQVIEIFPDIAVAHVKKLLEQHNGNPEPVVTLILGDETYPKEAPPSGASAAATPMAPIIRRSSSVVVERLRTAPKYDYYKYDSFAPTPAYLDQAMLQLMRDFPFLKIPTIRYVFKRMHNKYTLSRRHIHDAIVGRVTPVYLGAQVASTSKDVQLRKMQGAATNAAKPLNDKEEIQEYQTFKATLVRGTLSEEVTKRLGVEFLVKKPRNKNGTMFQPISDEILKDEVHHFEQNWKDWMEKVQKRLRREADRKLSVENGSAISCGCCYEDVAFSECVWCSDQGHMFCCECLRQYVETQVFGAGNLGNDKRTKMPATEIRCMSGKCNSGFNEDMLRNSLSEKTWEAYSELQHIAVVEQAGLADAMSNCPKCGFRAYVPDTQILFECPVHDCLYISCKKCGKDPHIPLRCEEVLQKQRQDEGRLKIEEALSEAKIRMCPKCKKKIIKEAGCNKMRCACGLFFCYVCRSPLDMNTPYAHFCQTPHCTHENCGKCKLHSNDKDDDEQAMREAGISAAERYKAEIERVDGTSEGLANVNLDVDQIMKGPSAPRS